MQPGGAGETEVTGTAKDTSDSIQFDFNNDLTEGESARLDKALEEEQEQ